MTNLKEKTIKTKIAHKGTYLTLNSDEVLLPNGNISTREWIKHPGAVCCIPILPDGKIGLIKQYRYGPRQEFIEIPAGKLDKEELPENCANRELAEEIGYKAKKLTLLTKIHPAIGFSNEVMWLFLGEQLVKTKRKLDHDEFLDLSPTSLEKAYDLILTGNITDVKTIIGIFWLHRELYKKR